MKFSFVIDENNLGGISVVLIGVYHSVMGISQNTPQ